MRKRNRLTALVVAMVLLCAMMVLPSSAASSPNVYLYTEFEPLDGGDEFWHGVTDVTDDVTVGTPLNEQGLTPDWADSVLLGWILWEVEYDGHYYYLSDAAIYDASNDPDAVLTQDHLDAVTDGFGILLEPVFEADSFAVFDGEAFFYTGDEPLETNDEISISDIKAIPAILFDVPLDEQDQIMQLFTPPSGHILSGWKFWSIGPYSSEVLDCLMTLDSADGSIDALDYDDLPYYFLIEPIFTPLYEITHQPTTDEPWVEVEHIETGAAPDPVEYQWYSAHTETNTYTVVYSNSPTASEIAAEEIWDGSFADGVWTSEDLSIDIAFKVNEGDIVTVTLPADWEGSVSEFNNRDDQYSNDGNGVWTKTITEKFAGSYNLYLEADRSIVTDEYEAVITVTRTEVLSEAVDGQTDYIFTGRDAGTYFCEITIPVNAGEVILISDSFDYVPAALDTPITPWPVTILPTTGGSVTSSVSETYVGGEVILTVLPETGYKLSSLTVFGADGSSVKFTDLGGGKYSFSMVKFGVTVSAKFVIDPSYDHIPYCPSLQYVDLDITQWYHEATDFVLIEELMKGIDDTHFEPYTTLDRATMLQTLYSIAGRPMIVSEQIFNDVAPDAEYADAVAWGYAAGIVNGYDNGNFGPKDPVSREQMAAFLYRYALYAGYDVKGSEAALAAFPDADKVSVWAKDALGWACSTGIINGMDGVLNPQGTSVRVQLAAMVHRFCLAYKA